MDLTLIYHYIPEIRELFLKLVSSNFILIRDRVFSMTTWSCLVRG